MRMGRTAVRPYKNPSLTSLEYLRQKKISSANLRESTLIFWAK